MHVYPTVRPFFWSGHSFFVISSIFSGSLFDKNGERVSQDRNPVTYNGWWSATTLSKYTDIRSCLMNFTINKTESTSTDGANQVWSSRVGAWSLISAAWTTTQHKCFCVMYMRYVYVIFLTPKSAFLKRGKLIEYYAIFHPGITWGSVISYRISI